MTQKNLVRCLLCGKSKDRAMFGRPGGTSNPGKIHKHCRRCVADRQKQRNADKGRLEQFGEDYSASEWLQRPILVSSRCMVL